MVRSNKLIKHIDDMEQSRRKHQGIKVTTEEVLGKKSED